MHTPIRNAFEKQNTVIVAVSEGIVDESGEYYSNMECLAGHDEFGHAQLSGSAKVVENILKLDKELKIHDFRIVEGITHTNILFDCIVPFEKDHTEESLKEYLLSNIKPEKEIYYYVIKIDRPYC